jgi:hypothetical protein
MIAVMGTTWEEVPLHSAPSYNPSLLSDKEEHERDGKGGAPRTPTPSQQPSKSGRLQLKIGGGKGGGKGDKGAAVGSRPPLLPLPRQDEKVDVDLSKRYVFFRGKVVLQDNQHLSLCAQRNGKWETVLVFTGGRMLLKDKGVAIQQCEWKRDRGFELDEKGRALDYLFKPLVESLVIGGQTFSFNVQIKRGIMLKVSLKTGWRVRKDVFGDDGFITVMPVLNHGAGYGLNAIDQVHVDRGHISFLKSCCLTC